MSNFIFNDFNPVSAAAWKQKIQFELDGADFNKTLLTQTSEGITIKPFYHLDEFIKIPNSTNTLNFKTCKPLNFSSEEITNKNIKKAIKQGFTAIKINSSKQFNTEFLFKDLLGKNIEFHFEFDFLSKVFLEDLSSFLKNETVFFNIDIIAHLAKTGNWFTSLKNDFDTIEALQNNQNLLSINANIYENSGANSVQQVAYALAHANEYFNKFDGEIATKMLFNFSIANNFFFEIAKIRAFKYLLNLILNKYNVKCTPNISTQKSEIFNQENTIYSSIISGSNTHISANTINNSKLENLKSIANNSYYIENITKQIAEKALLIFKDIEKSGGFLHQLKEGVIQRKIKENADKENLITIKSKKEVRKTLIIPLTNKKLKNEA